MTMNAMNESAQVIGSAIEVPVVHTTGAAAALLEPGDYLIELAFARPLARGALPEAMAQLGVQSFVLDESLRDGEPHAPADWSGRHDRDVTRLFLGPPTLVRFFGRLTQPLVATDGPEISWLFAERAGFDVYAEIRGDEALVPHELVAGKEYEFRLVSRMRAQQKRSAVVHALTELMGFDRLKLCALKRDMRLPGRPGASDMLWYGRARFAPKNMPPGAASYLTIEDPFFFQDVQETA